MRLCELALVSHGVSYPSSNCRVLVRVGRLHPADSLSLAGQAGSGSLSNICASKRSSSCDSPPLQNSANDHDDRKKHRPERDGHTKLNEERRQHGKNRHPDEGAKNTALAA